MPKKCYKCGGDMELGYMDNLRGPVFWKPKGYRLPLFPFIKKDKRLIQLGDGDFLHGGHVDAYYCSNCQIVFIDDCARRDRDFSHFQEQYCKSELIR